MSLGCGDLDDDDIDDDRGVDSDQSENFTSGKWIVVQDYSLTP